MILVDLTEQEIRDKSHKLSDVTLGYKDDIGGMSRAELDAELAKGIESLKSGRLYTADEVEVELIKEFGL